MKGCGILRASDIQFLDPEPNGAGVKSEDGGGATLAIDLPTGLVEDFQNMLPLHRFEIFKRLFSRVGRFLTKALRKLKHGSRAGDHGSFYDVFQFPNIAGSATKK